MVRTPALVVIPPPPFTRRPHAVKAWRATPRSGIVRRMTVILDITISLDGFVTGPDAGPGNGLGDGGMALHEWAIGDRTPQDVELLASGTAVTGAVVMG